MTFIAWLVGSKLGRYAAMAAVVLAGVSIVLLRAFAAGARKEKLKQLQGQLKNLQEGVKNSAEINSMSPSDRADELRKHWSR